MTKEFQYWKKNDKGQQTMKKTWIRRIAADVETKHGKEARDKIFGDIRQVKLDHHSLSVWFEKFTTGMDELGDKEFLQATMAKNCPCGPNKSGYERLAKFIRKSYDESETLGEFVEKLRKDGRTSQRLILDGNVLYTEKNPMKRKNVGSCGQGCHCHLACHAEKPVSDIFCHCCTVGHDGKAFRMAFGDDIKIKFAYSLINGGKACAAAIHLPEIGVYKLITEIADFPNDTVRFTSCFAAMLMRAENMGYSADRYAELYALYTAVTGFGFIPHYHSGDSSAADYNQTVNHQLHTFDQYISFTMDYAGYDYEELTFPEADRNTALSKIKSSINKNVPVLAQFGKSYDWVLVTGYDGDALIIRDGNETAVLTDWYIKSGHIIIPGAKKTPAVTVHDVFRRGLEIMKSLNK
jgi:hypothetical protein